MSGQWDSSLGDIEVQDGATSDGHDLPRAAGVQGPCNILFTVQFSRSELAASKGLQGRRQSGSRAHRGILACFASGLLLACLLLCAPLARLLVLGLLAGPCHALCLHHVLQAITFYTLTSQHLFVSPVAWQPSTGNGRST